MRQEQGQQLNKESLIKLIKKIETGDYPTVKQVVTVAEAARTTAEVAKVDIDQVEEALGGRK